ncbi:Rop family plasmid primer RNA-binding protein, partial [Escherichia coli]|nr:Rop family plasmid primer RNA-binding protein [Escherichia coli]
MTACSFHAKIITKRGKSPVTRQESATLNMAKFIRSQTLPPLERPEPTDLE